MRARLGILGGWAAVVAYAALLIVAGVDGAQQQGRVDRQVASTTAADRFVAAWERSRTATFVTAGTYERSSPITGARIASQDIVAQRPPRRLHRQLGGVDGRDDDRLVVCPAAPEGTDGPAPCHLGEAGGTTYAESVMGEVDALGSMVAGLDPLYAVTEIEAGCFSLKQTRAEPRAPFGIRARFCFDASTGAPSASRVEYNGGIVEVFAATEIRTDVGDADLEP